MPEESLEDEIRRLAEEVAAELDDSLTWMPRSPPSEAGCGRRRWAGPASGAEQIDEHPALGPAREKLRDRLRSLLA